MPEGAAVFLDRDGTMAPDVSYCSRPEDFNLFPETAKAIRRLRGHGFKVVVITNQSGVGRGYFSESTLAEIHEKMKRELAKKGAYLDGIYYCPHHPDDNCACRKPKSGMILQAARDHKIDMKESFLVGDSEADMELGRAVGCRTILIRSAKVDITTRPDIVVNNLLEAAERIVMKSGVV